MKQCGALQKVVSNHNRIPDSEMYGQFEEFPIVGKNFFFHCETTHTGVITTEVKYIHHDKEKGTVTFTTLNSIYTLKYNKV